MPIRPLNPQLCCLIAFRLGAFLLPLTQMQNPKDYDVAFDGKEWQYRPIVRDATQNALVLPPLEQGGVATPNDGDNPELDASASLNIGDLKPFSSLLPPLGSDLEFAPAVLSSQERLHRKKTEARSRYEDLSRRKDSAVLPILMQDFQKQISHAEQLRSEIQKVQQVVMGGASAQYDVRQDPNIMAGLPQPQTYDVRQDPNIMAGAGNGFVPPADPRQAAYMQALQKAQGVRSEMLGSISQQLAEASKQYGLSEQTLLELYTEALRAKAPQRGAPVPTLGEGIALGLAMLASGGRPDLVASQGMAHVRDRVEREFQNENIQYAADRENWRTRAGFAESNRNRWATRQDALQKGVWDLQGDIAEGDVLMAKTEHDRFIWDEEYRRKTEEDLRNHAQAIQLEAMRQGGRLNTKQRGFFEGLAKNVNLDGSIRGAALEELRDQGYAIPQEAIDAAYQQTPQYKKAEKDVELKGEQVQTQQANRELIKQRTETEKKRQQKIEQETIKLKKEIPWIDKHKRQALALGNVRIGQIKATLSKQNAELQIKQGTFDLKALKDQLVSVDKAYSTARSEVQSLEKELGFTRYFLSQEEDAAKRGQLQGQVEQLQERLATARDWMNNYKATAVEIRQRMDDPFWKECIAAIRAGADAEKVAELYKKRRYRSLFLDEAIGVGGEE